MSRIIHELEDRPFCFDLSGINIKVLTAPGSFVKGGLLKIVGGQQKSGSPLKIFNGGLDFEAK